MRDIRRLAHIHIPQQWQPKEISREVKALGFTDLYFFANRLEAGMDIGGGELNWLCPFNEANKDNYKKELRELARIPALEYLYYERFHSLGREGWGAKIRRRGAIQDDPAFFIGIILGEVMCSGVWVIVDYFADMVGNSRLF